MTSCMDDALGHICFLLGDGPWCGATVQVRVRVSVTVRVRVWVSIRFSIRVSIRVSVRVSDVLWFRLCFDFSYKKTFS